MSWRHQHVALWEHQYRREGESSPAFFPGSCSLLLAVFRNSRFTTGSLINLIIYHTACVFDLFKIAFCLAQYLVLAACFLNVHKYWWIDFNHTLIVVPHLYLSGRMCILRVRWLPVWRKGWWLRPSSRRGNSWDPRASRTNARRPSCEWPSSRQTTFTWIGISTSPAVMTVNASVKM